jgi:hypothetical protein
MWRQSTFSVFSSYFLFSIIHSTASLSCALWNFWNLILSPLKALHLYPLSPGKAFWVHIIPCESNAASSSSLCKLLSSSCLLWQHFSVILIHVNIFRLSSRQRSLFLSDVSALLRILLSWELSSFSFLLFSSVKLDPVSSLSITYTTLHCTHYGLHL